MHPAIPADRLQRLLSCQRQHSTWWQGAV